jgi:hypothetical protein
VFPEINFFYTIVLLLIGRTINAVDQRPEQDGGALREAAIESLTDSWVTGSFSPTSGEAIYTASTPLAFFTHLHEGLHEALFHQTSYGNFAMLLGRVCYWAQELGDSCRLRYYRELLHTVATHCVRTVETHATVVAWATGGDLRDAHLATSYLARRAPYYKECFAEYQRFAWAINLPPRPAWPLLQRCAIIAMDVPTDALPVSLIYKAEAFRERLTCECDVNKRFDQCLAITSQRALGERASLSELCDGAEQHPPVACEPPNAESLPNMLQRIRIAEGAGKPEECATNELHDRLHKGLGKPTTFSSALAKALSLASPSIPPHKTSVVLSGTPHDAVLRECGGMMVWQDRQATTGYMVGIFQSTWQQNYVYTMTRLEIESCLARFSEKPLFIASGDYDFGTLRPKGWSLPSGFRHYVVFCAQQSAVLDHLCRLIYSMHLRFLVAMLTVPGVEGVVHAWQPEKRAEACFVFLSSQLGVLNWSEAVDHLKTQNMVSDYGPDAPYHGVTARHLREFLLGR